MPSLLELKNQIEASNPKPAPNPMPVAPPERGDDVMAKAQALSGFNGEEKEFINLFKSSKEILDAKIVESPGHAERILGKLQKLHGADLAHAIVDEADQIKIEFMKQKSPELFNEGGAATVGFLNEASFGQLTRIMGKAGELINGQPAEDIIKAKAEEFRLLQKAFPKSDIAGRAASYMIPGSPAKALFAKAATFGSKAAGGIISKIVQNPGLLSKAMQSASAVGMGSAATAGVTNTGELALGDDEITFDRVVDAALSTGKAGVMGALLGGATPIAAAGAGAIARGVAPTVNAAAKGVSNSVAGAVEQLTGTSAKALRASNVRGPELRRAAGTQSDIGKDLVDFLQSKRAALPEQKLAQDLLPQLPNVDARPVLNYLRGVKKGIDPALDSKVGILQEWASRIEQSLPARSAGGQFKSRAVEVPATKMREIVDQMQDSVAEQYGRESPFLAMHLKNAARLARMSIVDTAQKSGGEVGKSYVDLMSKTAEKVGTLKFIRGQLGSTQEMQERNAQSFISNLFGKNKDVVRSRMADLDRQFGTNFIELSENAHLAGQLGPGGKPALFSNLGTGKAALGTVTGLATGGSTGAAAGALFSSPRAGAALLGASDKITGFVRRMVANPDALARIKTSGATPIQIRRIARDIENAFVKDGPISAGGVTRLVADTPYFVGLVDAFEKQERAAKNKTAESALSKMQGQQRNQEIAAPPQY